MLIGFLILLPPEETEARRIAFYRAELDPSYTDYVSETICVMDADLISPAEAVVDLLTNVDSRGACLGIAWSPDGTKIAFSAVAPSESAPLFGNRDVFVVDVVTRAIRNITNTPSTVEVYPAWSPDGTLIVYARDWLTLCTRRAAGSGSEATILPGGIQASTPAWSPDGRRMAYAKGVPRPGYDFDLDVAVRDLVTGQEQVFSDPDCVDMLPRWSPDGSRIAYTAFSISAYFGGPLLPSDCRVLTIGLDGTSRSPLLTGAMEAAWSPDGSDLVYVELTEQSATLGVALLGQLAVATPSGEKITSLTTGPGMSSHPAWCPTDRANEPPALVQDFTATNGEDGRSTLRWRNPPDSDLAEVIVCRRTDRFPGTHTDGTQCYRSTSPVPGGPAEYPDTGLTNGTKYYYAVFSRDVSGNWNDLVSVGSNAATGTPYVANQAPDTQITTTAVDQVHGSAQFAWTGTDDKTPTENLLFQYGLSPRDDWSSWATAGAKHLVLYTGLAPGSYRFEVRSKDAEGAVDPSPAVSEFSLQLAQPWTWVRVTPATAVIYQDTAGRPDLSRKVKQVPQGWVLRQLTEGGNPVNMNAMRKVQDVTDGTLGWIQGDAVQETLDGTNAKLIVRGTDDTKAEPKLELADRTFAGLTRDLKEGDSAKQVVLLEYLLRAENPLSGTGNAPTDRLFPQGYAVTEYFGPTTTAALKAYQIANGIGLTSNGEPSGRLDAATRAHFEGLIAAGKYDFDATRVQVVVEQVIDIVGTPPLWLASDFFREATREMKIAIILAVLTQESSIADKRWFDNELVALTPWGRGLMQIDKPDGCLDSDKPGYVGAGSQLVCYRDDGDTCNTCRGLYSRCRCYYSNSRQGIRTNILDGLWALNDKWKQARNAAEYADNDLVEQAVLEDGTRVSIYGKDLLWMSAIYRYNQGSPFKAQNVYVVWCKLWVNDCNAQIVGVPRPTDDWLRQVQEVARTHSSFRSCLAACERAGLITSSFYLMEVGDRLPLLGNDDYFGDRGQPYNAEDGNDLDQLAHKMAYANTHAIIYKLSSPGEIRVRDSAGRIAGMVGGTPVEEIPGAIYIDDAEMGVIFFPADTYEWTVEGTGSGTYTMGLLFVDGERLTAFTAQNMQMTAGAVHGYAVAWEALGRGEEGVTVSIDSNGDGTPEEVIQAGSVLEGGGAPGENSAPTVQITSPVSGAILKGRMVTISWEATDAESPPEELSVDLLFATTATGPWREIAADQEGRGSATWSVSEPVGADVWFEAIATDPAGASGSAVLGPLRVVLAEASIVAAPNPVPAAGAVFLYRLPEGTTSARLLLFDPTGRLLFETAVDEASDRFPAAGKWSPVDEEGVPLANGPYVYVLVADGKVVARGKMVVQR